MSRFFAGLQRSLKLKLKRAFFDGGANRQLQEQIDIHRLFLFTSLHAQKQLLGGRLPDGFTEGLIEQAKTLSFEQQRHFVHQQLQQQLVDIAGSIHESLLQAHDPRPAATAFEQAWQQMHPQLHSSSSSSSSGALLSQQQLRELVQQRLGYSLSVQPSKVAHQEAGMGLFLQGAALPGSLLALFPGLVYHKPVYRRMPGYPRIDVGNPYLTARYDHGIVDSLPWGRGWPAGSGVSAAAVAAAVAAPASKGLIGRMVAASDGPRKPIPETTWVHATTAEAAQLEMLEGRHPLALAHFANHPPAGAAPNAVIANFTFKVPAAAAAAAKPSSSSDQAAMQESKSQESSSSSSSSAAPWLRAYVPNIDYVEECSQQHLLKTEVSCVGLVAVAPLQSGSEVLFNYRLSPALLGRPAWYTPVDQNEENMRWA
ncbi:hypothetical protein OEZ85_013313 [Tetradesmus obliquus]|uniref:SET domain-containing protein n=1 Tax=Tetradesmus obliquus TaxID=3088 RepID=A0ABY8U5P4_TETOB|nr:hypothetical protein OEZ85_013313 [Tetradesmus obliquus]